MVTVTIICMAEKATIFSVAAMAGIEYWVGVKFCFNSVKISRTPLTTGDSDTDLLFGGAEDDYVFGK